MGKHTLKIFMAEINFPHTNQELLSAFFNENEPSPPSPTSQEVPLDFECHQVRGPRSLFAQLYVDSRILACLI